MEQLDDHAGQVDVVHVVGQHHLLELGTEQVRYQLLVLVDGRVLCSRFVLVAVGQAYNEL